MRQCNLLLKLVVHAAKGCDLLVVGGFRCLRVSVTAESNPLKDGKELGRLLSRLPLLTNERCYAAAFDLVWPKGSGLLLKRGGPLGLPKKRRILKPQLAASRQARGLGVCLGEPLHGCRRLLNLPANCFKPLLAYAPGSGDFVANSRGGFLRGNQGADELALHLARDRRELFSRGPQGLGKLFARRNHLPHPRDVFLTEDREVSSA